MPVSINDMKDKFVASGCVDTVSITCARMLGCRVVVDNDRYCSIKLTTSEV